MLNLTIGCDPELFLSNKNGFVSAYGLFPGTKAEPYKVNKGAVQVDGNALEFNIDPASTPKEFDENIQTVLEQMLDMVKQADKGLKLNFTPVARFDKKYFDHLPDEAKILGCDPDFNYQGTVNQDRQQLITMPVRTAAGHVHIGWTKGEDAMSPVHFEDCRFIAERFYRNGEYNNNLGRYNTYDENERLNHYGSYGAFRPKSYGVELRSFSNLWVEKPETRLKMFDYVVSNIRKMEKEAS